MRSTVVAALTLVGLVGQAPVVTAAPSCKRVASQWVVVFDAECIEWYENGKAGDGPPDACSQHVHGDLMVHAWPWNNEVAVVSTESLMGEDFSAVQPERNVTDYGAGVVIMYSSWDMMDGWVWHARYTSNDSARVDAAVDYITSEDEEGRYLSCNVQVEYKPPSMTMTTKSYASSMSRRLMGQDEHHQDVSAYTFGFGDEDAGSLPLQALKISENRELFADNPELFFPEDPSSAETFADMDERNGSFASGEEHYYAEYIYSYEDWSYSLSYSMELSELASYSFSYGDQEEGEQQQEEEAAEGGGGVPPTDAPLSISSVDIYICTDEDNTLVEVRWHCDPDDMGTAQCYDEAGGPNTNALEIHGFEMYCAPRCLTGGEGGLWCDIFGLDGCRMCTTDCSALCAEGELECGSCIRCPTEDDESPAPTAPALTTPAPTTPAPTTRSPTETAAPNLPAPHGYEFDTVSPTSGPTAAPSVYTKGPAVGPIGSVLPTPAPSASPPGMMVPTLAPTPGFTGGGFETPAPTLTLTPRGFESAAPTPSVREGEFTPSPVLYSNSAAPTSSPTGGEFEIFSPSTSFEDMPFTECTPGDARTCYDQLPPREMGALERSGRGLTCEESCIVRGGYWCKAYGLDGCRFCEIDCSNFCERQGLPEDCLCFEC